MNSQLFAIIHNSARLLCIRNPVDAINERFKVVIAAADELFTVASAGSRTLTDTLAGAPIFRRQPRPDRMSFQTGS